MYARTFLWLGGCALASHLLSGCALQKKDGADEFREAVPESEAVSLSGPDSSNGSSTTASAPPQRGALSISPPATAYSKWYGITRDMRDGVNTVTAGVLGGVWLIIQSEPSRTTKDSATWGPYTDQLDPATYRFRVTRVATDDYDYVLEGRPKASTSDADYQAVLTGQGYGKPSSLHGQGSFAIDLDAAKALDPYKHPNDSGTVTIVHDLPRDFSEHLGALPRTITATVMPQGEAHYSVKSVANLDYTGSIQVDAHVDTDDSKRTLLEDVTVDSRWRASGAGRADITIAGGDLPASIPVVDATECWSTDFTRAYYSDSVGFAPTVGDASACVY